MLLNSPTETYASRLCAFFRPEGRIIVLTFVMCVVIRSIRLCQAGMLHGLLLVLHHLYVLISHFSKWRKAFGEDTVMQL